MKRPSPEGLAAAREFARWHLGYGQWADDILAAYFHPAEALARLARERGEVEEDKPCERCAFIPTPDGKCVCREVGE